MQKKPNNWNWTWNEQMKYNLGFIDIPQQTIQTISAEASHLSTNLWRVSMRKACEDGLNLAKCGHYRKNTVWRIKSTNTDSWF